MDVVAQVLETAAERDEKGAENEGEQATSPNKTENVTFVAKVMQWAIREIARHGEESV